MSFWKPAPPIRLYGRLTALAGLFAGMLTLLQPPAQAQLAYAPTVGGNLYSLNLSAGTATLIGNTGVSLLEGLAIAPDGTLFGTDSSGQLYHINPTTAAVTLIGNTGRGNIEGLDFNNNTLLGITFENTPTVFSINTTNASTSNVVTAANPTGLVRALTVANAGDVLIRTDLPTLDTLRALSLATGASNIRGTIGSEDVYGLDFATDGNLYGVNFNGQILRINPANAGTVVVGNTGLRFLDLTAASENAVPEPGTMALLAGSALSGVVFAWRRRRLRK